MRLTAASVVLLLGLAAIIIWLWGKREVAASVFTGEPTVSYTAGSVIGAARK